MNEEAAAIERSDGQGITVRAIRAQGAARPAAQSHHRRHADRALPTAAHRPSPARCWRRFFGARDLAHSPQAADDVRAIPAHIAAIHERPGTRGAMMMLVLHRADDVLAGARDPAVGDGGALDRRAKKQAAQPRAAAGDAHPHLGAASSAKADREFVLPVLGPVAARLRHLRDRRLLRDAGARVFPPGSSRRPSCSPSGLVGPRLAAVLAVTFGIMMSVARPPDLQSAAGPSRACSCCR